MNELFAGLLMEEWANQSLPRSKERSTAMSFPPTPPETQLHAVIENLKCVIAKKDAEIDRLRRQLNEERVARDKQCLLGEKHSE